MGAPESLCGRDNTGLAVCLQLIANVGCGSFVSESSDLKAIPGPFSLNLRALELGRVLAENRHIRLLDSAPSLGSKRIRRERAKLNCDGTTCRNRRARLDRSTLARRHSRRRRDRLG